MMALLLPVASAVVIMASSNQETQGAVNTSVQLSLHLRRHGLCNRLRSFAAAHIVASDLHLPLNLDWQREASCNATFQDLFEVAYAGDKTFAAAVSAPSVRVFPDTYGRSAADFKRNNDTEERATRVASIKQNTNEGTWDTVSHAFMHVKTAFLRVGELHALATKYIEDRQPATIHITSDTPNAPEYLTCGEFARRKSLFYRSLQPIAPIRLAVAKVTTALRSRASNVVGVHFRSHDSAHDYAVVPGSSGPVLFGSQEAGPIGAFAQVLKFLQGQQPDTVFFLSTNDCTGAVAQALREAVGKESIITAQETLEQHSGPWNTLMAGFCDTSLPKGSRNQASAQAALVDWLLLGKTDILVGTHWSSFTEEAMTVHSIPLLTIVSGKYVAMIPSLDSTVSCGQPAYVNRYIANRNASAPLFHSLADYLAATNHEFDDTASSFGIAPCSGPRAAAVVEKWHISKDMLYCIDETAALNRLKQ
jgi:hypothetical protein